MISTVVNDDTNFTIDVRILSTVCVLGPQILKLTTLIEQIRQTLGAIIGMFDYLNSLDMLRCFVING